MVKQSGWLKIMSFLLIFSAAGVFFYCGELLSGKVYQYYVSLREPHEQRIGAVEWRSADFMTFLGKNAIHEKGATFFLDSGCCEDYKSSYVSVITGEIEKAINWFEKNESYREVNGKAAVYFEADLPCKIGPGCRNMVWYNPGNDFKVVASNLGENSVSKVRIFVKNNISIASQTPR